MKDKERRPSKKNSKKENKKYPYKRMKSVRNRGKGKRQDKKEKVITDSFDEENMNNKLYNESQQSI